MFPAEPIVRAAARWLKLLRASTLSQASSIIRADPSYTDLTQTQYASGLDLLRSLGLLVEGFSKGLEVASAIRQLHEEQLSHLLFQRVIESATPAWLPDADLLVPDVGEVPQDAAALAESLGLTQQVAFGVINHLHGRVDLADRARVGLAGERALIEFLEERWPGSTTHVAMTDDSFGYDILFQHQNERWHLEVKTTTRRGRLVIYLSRHEHEVSFLDPQWRLVVLGLDDQLRLSAIATVRHPELFKRAPRDTCSEAKWQSTSHELTANDLQRGLSFLKGTLIDQACPQTVPEMLRRFTWLPHP